MRILFLTTQLPYPPQSGGLIKSWNLVDHWSKKHELLLIHPLKNGDSDYLEEFKTKVTLKEHFYVPLDRSRTPFNLLRSYLKHASLNVYRNFHQSIKEKVQALSTSVDIIFLDHYELGQYIPGSYMGKVVLHEHNAEFIMWKRLAELEKNPIKKLLLNIESGRILKAEKTYAGRADLVLAAPNDIDELCSQGVDRKKMRKTYHLGEDFMLDAAPMQFEKTKKSLLYIGTLTWEANVDGLIWFIDNCWTELRSRNPDLILSIVGKNPDERIIQLAEDNEGIELRGFVRDLEDCYPIHRVFIVPLRFGSGIKVKILNALYRGIPTVTTAIGTEGLETIDGKHLFECTGAEDFIDKVDVLLKDKELWRSMSDASRELSRKYTWKSLLAEHDSQLESLI
ncbi:MAG: glycosyltransferase [Flavobacteriales bacterium]|nr:glycosyltransferase [Flavobacteriales bacterium]